MGSVAINYFGVLEKIYYTKLTVTDIVRNMDISLGTNPQYIYMSKKIKATSTNHQEHVREIESMYLFPLFERKTNISKVRVLSLNY